MYKTLKIFSFILTMLLILSCEKERKEIKILDMQCSSSEMKEYFNSLRTVYDTLSKYKSYLDITKKPFKFIRQREIHENVSPLDLSSGERYYKTFKVSNLKGEKGKFFTSISHLEPNIGNLLMVDSTKEMITFLYLSHKYDSGSLGYWIAFSKNEGKSWQNYYTGLSMNYPYHIKPKSNLRIWKNKNTFQFEVAIVKNVGDVVGHWSFPKYITVKDSLIIEFELSDISLDSDRDGLTDIVENKFLLNPNDKDTDRDGLIDGEDTNPKNKINKVELYGFYKKIVQSSISKYEFVSKTEPILQENKASKKSDKMKIILSDNKELLGIHPDYGQIIILSNEEYKEYMLKYPSTSSVIEITPLFACDSLNNTYKILRTTESSQQSVFIEKVDSGYFIKPGLMAIQ